MDQNRRVHENFTWHQEHVKHTEDKNYELMFPYNTNVVGLHHYFNNISFLHRFYLAVLKYYYFIVFFIP